jgi:hypothetical protein
MASTGGHDIPQVIGTELVFVDPDNGLEPASYRETLASSAKGCRVTAVCFWKIYKAAIE